VNKWLDASAGVMPPAVPGNTRTFLDSGSQSLSARSESDPPKDDEAARKVAPSGDLMRCKKNCCNATGCRDLSLKALKRRAFFLVREMLK
jgi:hypothetical protein